MLCPEAGHNRSRQFPISVFAQAGGGVRDNKRVEIMTGKYEKE
jgi:hypothetical protein